MPITRILGLIALLMGLLAGPQAAIAWHNEKTDASDVPADEGGIAGNPCGSPSAGSCFVVHSTPGCSNGFCCAGICAMDPFCCETSWDAFCVGSANQFCTGCGGWGVGSCFTPHANAACDNETCCNLVCSQDAFCCTTAWDSLCANAANALCNCGAPLAGSCFEVHSTPWCNNSICCNTVCLVYPFCCEVSWDSDCVDIAGQLCTCGGVYTKSCFKVHNKPWCSRGACCDEVCALDPFCCQVEWDSFCVGGAFINCCPADVYPCNDGDGWVNIDDLLAILTMWGPVPPGTFDCVRDVAPNGGNGAVNVDDLLFILNRWGPCT